MGVLRDFNKSVREAVKDGRIDKSKHAAAISAAKKLAELMDTPDWPIVQGKIDNVTPSVYLKYCEALSLTPASKGKKTSAKAEKTEAADTKIVAFRGASKYAR